MSTSKKLIAKLQSSPSDFTWSETKTLLSGLGFAPVKTGRTGGSRRRFYKEKANKYIRHHEPHPSRVLPKYAVSDLVKALKDYGLI